MKWWLMHSGVVIDAVQSDHLRRRLMRGGEGVIDKRGDVVIDGQHTH